MRIAYLDCFSGVSGDMFLGALLDAGVPFELFEKTVAGLNVGAKLERSRVDRGGISATKLDVVVNGEKDMPREEFWAQSVASGQWSVTRRTSTTCIIVTSKSIPILTVVVLSTRKLKRQYMSTGARHRSWRTRLTTVAFSSARS